MSRNRATFITNEHMTMEDEKGPGGRPTKFDESLIDQAYKLSLLGATDEQIAAFFEVAVSTIYLWKTTHIQFSEALKRGKLIADSQVANKLFTRAMGYNYDEVHFEKVAPKDVLEETDNGELKESDAYRKRVITKEVVPDVAAQIFWLKNRQPALWRDKQEVDHTTKGEAINSQPDLSKYSDDELRTLAELQRKGGTSQA